MGPKKQLETFANKVYLVIKNRHYDDIEGEDGQEFVSQVTDWVNMFLDELRTTVNNDGQLIDWYFNRSAAYTLGTATEGASSISMPSAVERLITDEQRYVQILQDGTAVSNWVVVAPKDITNRTDRITEDMCAQVGTSLVFSRAFKDTEASGTIVGDVVLTIPDVSATNVKALTQVKPQLLLILGVAKNAILPDIVQGGLSPSYTQKFNEVLTGAIARSNATSTSAQASRDSYSNVRGVY